MATTLYFRNTTWDTNRYKLETTQGSSNDTAVANTATSTEVQWTNTAGGSAIEWCTGGLNAAATISGSVTFSLGGVESHMNANAGFRARLYKVSADRATWTEMGGGPFHDNAELAVTTATSYMTWTGTPTSNNALSAGERLGVRVFIDDNCGSAQASGYTATFYFNNTGNYYNSYIKTTETLTVGDQTCSRGVGTVVFAGQAPLAELRDIPPASFAGCDFTYISGTFSDLQSANSVGRVYSGSTVGGVVDHLWAVQPETEGTLLKLVATWTGSTPLLVESYTGVGWGGGDDSIGATPTNIILSTPFFLDAHEIRIRAEATETGTLTIDRLVVTSEPSNISITPDAGTGLFAGAAPSVGVSISPAAGAFIPKKLHIIDILPHHLDQLSHSVCILLYINGEQVSYIFMKLSPGLEYIWGNNSSLLADHWFYRCDAKRFDRCP